MNRIFILLVCVVTLASCKKNTNFSSKQGELVDIGFIADTEIDMVNNQFQPIVLYNNEVFVATKNGIWKSGLTTVSWSQVGLAGKNIISLYAHPEKPGHFYAGVRTNDATDKSLYISSNGGVSWVSASDLPFDRLSNRYEPFHYLIARPGHPNHLFANLTSVTIAVSKDGGHSWNRMNYMNDSYAASYDCPLHFLPGNPNEVFIGAEAPLDDAWLGKYEIDAADPVRLKNFRKVVDATHWHYRRPNQIESSKSAPSSLYVGQEGALSKVTGNQFKFIFKVEGSGHDGPFPPAYIAGIWVDPKDPRHILFGGRPQAPDPKCDCLSLFETYDEGGNIIHIKNKLGLGFPKVLKIMDNGAHPIILLADTYTGKLKLALYKPAR